MLSVRPCVAINWHFQMAPQNHAVPVSNVYSKDPLFTAISFLCSGGHRRWSTVERDKEHDAIISIALYSKEN